jgi:NADPH-dependent FMN reductase
MILHCCCAELDCCRDSRFIMSPSDAEKRVNITETVKVLIVGVPNGSNSTQGEHKMSSPVRILGIAGSLWRDSFNRATRRAASELAPEGASIETSSWMVSPASMRTTSKIRPGKVVELKQRVREADPILFVTPELNYSTPGVLKNAIDRASRPYGDSAWNGKPAAFSGASIARFY